MKVVVLYEVSVSVVTLPMRAGQSVTIGAQEVTVYTNVSYSVDVEVLYTGLVVGVDVGVDPTGHTVV